MVLDRDDGAPTTPLQGVVSTCCPDFAIVTPQIYPLQVCRIFECRPAWSAYVLYKVAKCLS